MIYYSRATLLQATVEISRPAVQALVEIDKPATQAMVEIDKPATRATGETNRLATQAMVEIPVIPTVLPTLELVPRAMGETNRLATQAMVEIPVIPTALPTLELAPRATAMTPLTQEPALPGMEAREGTMIHTDLPTPSPRAMAGTPLGLQAMVEIMMIHTAPLAIKRATLLLAN